MKRKLLFSTFAFICVHFNYAQTLMLYGTTYGGGAYGNGTVFSYNLSDGKENVVINFDTLNGIGPLGNLTQDTLSKLLYGTTAEGGDSNRGVLFSYNLVSGKDSTLNLFRGTNGKYPGEGNMIQYNKALYGMTSSGGKYGFGTIFMYNLLTGKDSVIVNFDTGGRKEYDPLGSNLALFPGNGLLYGMTYEGGLYGNGAIFSFNPSTGKDSVVASLNINNGAQAQEGTLTYNPKDELFYGLTSAGGNYGNGVLFSFNPLTGKDTALIHFNVLNGTSPYGGLLLDSLNGLFYGMTNTGGLYDDGVLFSYDPVAAKENVLFNFNDTLGSLPTGNVILGPGGILYGTTDEDQNGNGVLFSYDPVASKYKVLFAFNYSNGSGPYGSLTLVNAPVTTAINEVFETNSVKIYPNPGNGVFTVESSVVSQKSLVEIYNVLGEKIFSQSSILHAPFSIDISNQPSGVYLLKLYDAQHQTISTQKIVIQ